MADQFSFQIKTLVNELAPALILLELAVQKESRSAAQLNREITQGRFLRSQGNEEFRFQPSLIYNLLKNMVAEGLISRNDDENTYKLEKKGEQHLASQKIRLKEFANDLREFVEMLK